MADTDKIAGPPEWSSGYVPTVLLFKDGELAEPAWAGSDWGRMEAFAATPSGGGGGGGGYIHQDWCNQECGEACNPDGQKAKEHAAEWIYVPGYLPQGNNVEVGEMTIEEAQTKCQAAGGLGITWNGDRNPGRINIWIKTKECDSGTGQGDGWHTMLMS